MAGRACRASRRPPGRCLAWRAGEEPPTVRTDAHAERLNAPKLQSCSAEMTAIGDEWRTFASLAVRQCRKPKSGGYAEVAAKLRKIATQEEALWREIKRVAADL